MCNHFSPFTILLAFAMLMLWHIAAADTCNVDCNAKRAEPSVKIG